MSAALLWTSLTFVGRSSYPRHEAYLERSQGAPLFIRILPQGFEVSIIPRVRRVMALIRPHCARWKSLVIETGFPEKGFIVIGDNLRYMSVPELETFSVTQTGWNTPTRWSFRPFLEGAPKLEHLALRRVPWHTKLLPTQSLTTLTLDNGFARGARVGALEIHAILKQSPHLREIVLWSSQTTRMEDVPDLGSDTFIHASITKLVLESSEDMDALLSRVRMPALRLLAARYRMPPRLFRTVSSFNDLSSLSDLTIAGIATADEQKEFARMLGTLTGLVELRIEGFNFDDESTLGCLKTACPLLTSLSLKWCTGLTSKAIRAVVEYRRLPSSGMRSVENLWVAGCALDEEDQSWLQDNVAAMLVVD